MPQQPGTVGSTHRPGAPLPALPSEQQPHPPTPHSQPPTPQSQLPTRRNPPPIQISQPPIRRHHPPTQPSLSAVPKQQRPARLCLGRPVRRLQPPRLVAGILLPLVAGDQPPVGGHLPLAPPQGLLLLLPTSHAPPTAQNPCLLTFPSCPPPQQRPAPARPSAQRRPPGRRGSVGKSMSCRYHRSRHALKSMNCPASTAKPSQRAIPTRALRH